MVRKLSYGQTVYVNGQRGQVISKDNSGSSTVETRSSSGKSQTHTLTGYDKVFRSQIGASTPSYRLPNWKGQY